MKRNTIHIGHKPYLIGCIAAMLVLCPCGQMQAASETIGQAVEHTIAGQWDAAFSILNNSDCSDPRIEQFKHLLQEHQSAEQQRQRQRHAVFEEKRQALTALETDKLDEGDLLKAMELFRSAWNNADGSERDELKACSVFQSLRQAAHERFVADEQAGRWDGAWTQWLRWLVEFEPQLYKEASDELQERRLIANALRQNPCDKTAVPYSQVKRDTAVQMFAVLHERYAEQVSFADISAHGLRRLARLPSVLSNPTITFAVCADPDGVEAWNEHLDALQSAELPAGSDALASLLETLTAINDTTLKLPEGVIVAQFTEAALASLDPYTEAVWPEGIGLFEKNLTGQFGGIGIRIRKDGENLVIVSVIPDTPAAETSLVAEDIIVAVDGRSTRDMPTNCAVSLISGPVGTAVSLTVRRDGIDEDQVVTVMRQKIVLPTVEGSQRADNSGGQGHWDYFLDAENRIGYLQLNGFTQKTAEQARGVLDELGNKDVAGLIIDVRGNGGGLLSEAAAFADMFIDDGILLASRARGNNTRIWKADNCAVKRDYPIAILIDDGSASASEIVAAVLAVRKPGQTLLIGRRTYGKGTIQEVADLGPDGGRLKLTTAYYYLPNDKPVRNRYKLQAEGRTDWGVAPHIDIPLYAFETARIRQIQLERRKQLMAKEMPQNPADQTEPIVRQMLAADAQLSTALVVLKAKILADSF